MLSRPATATPQHAAATAGAAAVGAATVRAVDVDVDAVGGGLSVLGYDWGCARGQQVAESDHVDQRRQPARTDQHL